MPEILSQTPAWLLILAAIGAAAAVSAVVTLFVRLHRPERIALTTRPRVGSTAFMKTVAGVVNAPLMQGGSARLLNNGVEIFPAMVDAMRHARSTINFMVYIWEDGTVSDRLIEVLSERARAGVEVRLLLDGFGAFTAPRRKLKAIQDAGGQLRFFHPIHLGRLTTSYKRNHGRAIVVDGSVGFTGGAAVGDKWLGDAQDEDHWREVMVQVYGCLATNLQSAFAQLWSTSTGEILAGEEFWPVHHEEVSGAEKLSQHVNVISTPSNGSAPLRSFFYTTLACARETIYLTNAYFAPDENIRTILRERAEAGLDVRLLLPNRLTDLPPVRWAGQHFFRELLESGVRIYEYQPTMIHSKVLVVDGVWTVIGSANIDIRSKELNLEAVVGILDEGFGRQVRDTFMDDLVPAREITLDAWNRRGILRRLNERFWVTFVEQL